MVRPGLIVALAGVLGIGLVISVRDWRAWNLEETKNFGHGPGELYTPAELFTDHYANQFVGIKFNYPGSWKQTANNKLQISDPNLSLDEVVGKENPVEVVRFESEHSFGQKIILSVRLLDKGTSLNQIIDEKSGSNRERTYINSDFGSWTMVTFKNQDSTIRKVYAAKEEKLFEIDFEYKTDEEFKLLRTYEELVRGIIII